MIQERSEEQMHMVRHDNRRMKMHTAAVIEHDMSHCQITRDRRKYPSRGGRERDEVRSEIAKPLATDSPNIDTGRPAGKNPAITRTSAMPPASPIAAPTTDSVTASIRNCPKISALVAPIDLRNPISKRRSPTEIFSTEKIPTPPMSSDTPAIEKNTMRQLRRTRRMLPRSLRISLPTFSTCTS